MTEPAYKCIVCETGHLRPDYPWDKHDVKVFNMCQKHQDQYKTVERKKKSA